MTTFYFHMRDSDGLVEDPDGSELVDLEAAIEEAKAAARALVADRIQRNKRLRPTTIEITDEKGNVLHTVTFREVLEDALDPLLRAPCAFAHPAPDSTRS